jgi:hypothetical protein
MTKLFDPGSAPDRLGKALVELGMQIDCFELTRMPSCAYRTLSKPAYDLLVYAMRDGRPVKAYAGLVDPAALLPAVEACRTDLEAIDAARRLRPSLQAELEAMWPARTCDAVGHDRAAFAGWKPGFDAYCRRCLVAL